MRELAAAALLSAACARPPERPSFLVLAPDTLRADRVIAPAGEKPVAANLASFAERGTVFSSAWTQGAWTLPALSSLLRGRYPNAVDLARGEGGWFGEGERTLPEILGYYGYHTVAFWGESLPGTMRAFHAGFAVNATAPPGSRPGDEVARWLLAGPPEPFFALVHDVDLHVAPLEGAVQAAAGAGAASEATRDALRSVYAAEYDARVRRFDEGAARVLDALDRTGLGRGTVVVVLSNHGEDLLDHTWIPDHGILYDSVLRVPLAIVDPAAPPGRVDLPVRLVDVAPTILERAGIPADAGMDGRSLGPLLRGAPDDPPREPIFALSNPDNAAVRTGGAKLVACAGSGCRAGAPGGREPGYHGFEAYDLAADPAERRDVFAERSEEWVEEAAELLRWKEERRAAAGAAARWEVEREERRVLKERGYWGQVEGR